MLTDLQHFEVIEVVTKRHSFCRSKIHRLLKMLNGRTFRGLGIHHIQPDFCTHHDFMRCAKLCVHGREQELFRTVKVTNCYLNKLVFDLKQIRHIFTAVVVLLKFFQRLLIMRFDVRRALATQYDVRSVNFTSRFHNLRHFRFRNGATVELFVLVHHQGAVFSHIQQSVFDWRERVSQTVILTTRRSGEQNTLLFQLQKQIEKLRIQTTVLVKQCAIHIGSNKFDANL
ncbi:hypothetical protein VMC_04690 [Vibrio alginolyticus 40B]|nr:hypothetical protein VMC_04690 [Vibrio alginolyticus 40B]